MGSDQVNISYLQIKSVKKSGPLGSSSITVKVTDHSWIGDEDSTVEQGCRRYPLFTTQDSIVSVFSFSQIDQGR